MTNTYMNIYINTYIHICIYIYMYMYFFATNTNPKRTVWSFIVLRECAMLYEGVQATGDRARA